MNKNENIMKKVKIHVCNDYTFLDDDVYVEIELPTIPRIGEIVYLNDDLFNKLEKQIKSSLKKAQEYCPKWIYGKSYDCDDPKKENLSDISITDIMYVTSIAYEANSDVISIELNDTQKDD